MLFGLIIRFLCRVLSQNLFHHILWLYLVYHSQNNNNERPNCNYSVVVLFCFVLFFGSNSNYSVKYARKVPPEHKNRTKEALNCCGTLTLVV